MPIDPYIARGAQIGDPARTLAQIAALTQRDQALAQDQQAFQLNQQKLQRDVAAQQKADLLWDDGIADIESKDPARMEMGKIKILRADPAAGAALLKVKGLDGGSPDDHVGKYNPGDYTTPSWAKFVASGYTTPEVLEMKPYAPPSPLMAVSPGFGVGLVSRGGPTGPAGSVVQQFTTPEQEAAARAAAAGAEKTATVGAEALATGAANLPKAEYAADQIITTIENLGKHPGTKFLYGKYALSPIVPGTDQAGAGSYLEQIGGQAFLQAFESLKGGGQITEIEGTKATQALTRLTDRKIKYEDALAAMREFVTQVRKGVALARRRAGMGQSTGGAPRAAGAAPADDPLGIL